MSHFKTTQKEADASILSALDEKLSLQAQIRQLAQTMEAINKRLSVLETGEQVPYQPEIEAIPSMETTDMTPISKAIEALAEETPAEVPPVVEAVVDEVYAELSEELYRRS